jgi:hypothetical protein
MMDTLPTPFYQDDSCTLYCADCRDILHLLPKPDLIRYGNRQALFMVVLSVVGLKLSALALD